EAGGNALDPQVVLWSDRSSGQFVCGEIGEAPVHVDEPVEDVRRVLSEEIPTLEPIPNQGRHLPEPGVDDRIWLDPMPGFGGNGWTLSLGESLLDVEQ